MTPCDGQTVSEHEVLTNRLYYSYLLLDYSSPKPPWCTKTMVTAATMEDRIHQIQAIIGTDAGERGMKDLIVPGDLLESARAWARLSFEARDDGADDSDDNDKHNGNESKTTATVVVLSGFPCHIDCVPPTETDGPAGSIALCRTALALGHRAVLVTDECNATVFRVAAEKLLAMNDNSNKKNLFEFKSFPAFCDDPQNDSDDGTARLSWEQFKSWVASNHPSFLVACERAGPARDGVCYTMRGLSMSNLVAPLHQLVVERERKPFGQPPPLFVAIGDGGNELGMGKVIHAIENHIPFGKTIGCVVPADHLIASSVSNWGAYGLAAAVALCRAELDPSFGKTGADADIGIVQEWIYRCLPTEQDEVDLLDRCVQAGSRDGVTGKMEATVDGLPLEQSLQCLRDIRAAALGKRTLL